MHDNGALRGINIADGKQLWELPAGSAMNLPMVQPHDAGNNSLVLSSEPDLTMIDIKRDGDIVELPPKPGEITNFAPASTTSSFTKIASSPSTTACCAASISRPAKDFGKKAASTMGRYSLLPDQDLLLLLAEKGDTILVSVDRKEFKELGRFKALEGKTWNSPVLVGNRLYARNGEEMAAFELNTEDAPSP